MSNYLSEDVYEKTFRLICEAYGGSYYKLTDKDDNPIGSQSQEKLHDIWQKFKKGSDKYPLNARRSGDDIIFSHKDGDGTTSFLTKERKYVSDGTGIAYDDGYDYRDRKYYLPQPYVASAQKPTTVFKDKWTGRNIRRDGLYYGDPKKTSWQGDIPNKYDKED